MNSSPTENDIVSRLILIDEMSEEIKAIRANSETQLKRIGDEVRKAQGAFSGLGNEIKGSFLAAVKSGIMAYAGFEVINKITGFLKDSRAESQENAAMQLKLRTALGFTSAALNEQASILGKKLVVDDDEITAVQAMLANYVKSEDAIRRLTPAVLDLAAATGMGMAQAANMVARGIADDGVELGRFKIAVDGAAGSAERIDSIIAGLNKNFGDQAVKIAEAKDFWDRLGVSIKQFKETVGIGLFGTDDQREKQQYENAKQRLEDLAEARLDYAGRSRQALEADIKIVEAYEKKQDEIRKASANKKTETNYGNVDALKKVMEEQSKVRKEQQKKDSEEQEKLAAESLQLTRSLAQHDKDETARLQREQLQKEQAAREEAGKKESDRLKIESDRIKADIADKEKSWKAYYKNLWELQKAQDKLTQQQRESTLRGTVDNIGVMAQKWHQFGAVYKRMAQAEAIVDTYTGATAAYKAMAGIPVVGPALGIAAAAAAIGAGTAHIAAIEAQQFAIGTPYAPGGLSWVGERGPELMRIPRGAQIYTHTESKEIANNNTSLVVNIQGSNGSVTETLRAELRSGAADGLISLIKQRMN